MFRRGILLFCLIFLVIAGMSQAVSYFDSEKHNSETLARPEEFKSPSGQPDVNKIFAEINEVRSTQGLQPLEKNTQLTLLAQDRAEDMRKHLYYGHKNPNGKLFYDLMRQSSYGVDYGCENLDLQFSLSSSVYVSDWLKSKKGHRECVLDKRVSEAGYAVSQLPTVAGENVPTYVVVAIHSTTPKNL